MVKANHSELDRVWIACHGNVCVMHPALWNDVPAPANMRSAYAHCHAFEQWCAARTARREHSSPAFKRASVGAVAMLAVMALLTFEPHGPRCLQERQRALLRRQAFL
jgi:hypothetical protein